MSLRILIAALLYPPRCPFCGQVIAHGEALCASCRGRVSMPLYEVPLSGAQTRTCCAPFSYVGQVRAAIVRYKFHGKKSYAAAFGVAMANAFRVCQPGVRPDVITCVPLSPQRRRSNLEQHTLPREQRIQNVQGVYVMRRGADVAGKTVLLCDDIVTTGATLAECVRVLQAGGAGNVHCAAIAAVLPNL